MIRNSPESRLYDLVSVLFETQRRAPAKNSGDPPGDSFCSGVVVRMNSLYKSGPWKWNLGAFSPDPTEKHVWTLHAFSCWQTL